MQRLDIQGDGFCDNLPWPELSEFSKTRKDPERKQSGTELQELRLFLGAIPKQVQYFGQKCDVFYGNLLHNPG